MKISAFDARVGNLVEYQAKLWRVLKKNHVKPGKGGAFVQLEMKCISDGTKLNEGSEEGCKSCLNTTVNKFRERVRETELRAQRQPSKAKIGVLCH